MLSSSAVYSQQPSAVDTIAAASTWVEETPVKPAAPATTTKAAPKATPAATETKTTSAAVGEGQVYVVVSGDMLWKIAQKHNLTLEQLLALNPQLKNPNKIAVGQKIIVAAAAPSATASATTSAAVPSSVKVYQGLGHTTTFRNGPGTDSEGVPVYSFNVAMAQATFDAEGRILSVYIDGYEVSTPNYDGASMPHFSGWPDKEGYNVTDHDAEKVTGVSVNTKESAAAEVNGWQTKRQRGDSYHMNPANEWYKQMDFFQKFFVGKTVAELEAWFEKNTTAAGRPIKASTTNEAELAKLAKLTDAEKAALADVVSGATMSIRDAHGDFLGAVANAYENRVEVVIPVK
ncbi:LysM repeat protein [Anaerosolibacter carboniphilus]|uniref:LysM repeat protein n=1 Tax=Anaerosolibacter carboniphilus TaxID=1417629 RepID=A0A841KYX0_9FIRM|nr:LysM domain-containing protein [Anaerosolibacter carboniphilus]MBB6216102.1 LysM repeat protein [Anaerosolibacter carboniphilus]